MRLIIAAIGKLKDAEERNICDRYGKRLATAGKAIGIGPLDIVEMNESRNDTTISRKTDEAERLLKASAGASIKIALDPAGRALSSEAFAQFLSKQANGGAKSCAFLIGGPDGHGQAVLEVAELRLSLGAMTLPHGLARVVLVEQIYRAATILTGHPYHRA